MRILIVVTSLVSGGAERVASNLASTWTNQNHEVSVLTVASKDYDFYTLDAHVNRYELSATAPSRSMFHGLLAGFRRVLGLRGIIKRDNPDLVVALMAKTNVLTLLAGFGLSKHVVVCEHNYPPRSVDARIWSFLRKYVYTQAKTVIALNTTGAEWLKKYTYSRCVKSIPNALVWPLVNLDPHVCVPERSSEDFIFLSVGRLHKQKRFDRLIDSFEKVVKEKPHVKLYIVGVGELENELQAHVERLGLLQSVYFVGKVGNIVDWYNFSDAFVLSSDFEGFPGCLLEAMAAGKPVVSVNCNTGPRDIIEHGENGLLCKVDVTDLANAMSSLVNDPVLCKRLSSNSVGVIEEYSESRIQKLWDEEFSKVAKVTS